MEREATHLDRAPQGSTDSSVQEAVVENFEQQQAVQLVNQGAPRFVSQGETGRRLNYLTHTDNVENLVQPSLYRMLLQKHPDRRRGLWLGREEMGIAMDISRIQLEQQPANQGLIAQGKWTSLFFLKLNLSSRHHRRQRCRLLRPGGQASLQRQRLGQRRPLLQGAGTLAESRRRATPRCRAATSAPASQGPGHAGR